MPFDPKQLRGFVAVSEAGTIGMAAKAINISQPALSRIISTLEDRNGIRLFERTPTGMTLTQAGEAFLPHARMLLFELESASDELKSFRGLRKGTVRVGAVAAVVRTILAPAIADLLIRFPELNIEIIESHDDVLFSSLLGNQIDLVLSVDTHNSDQISTIAECRFEDCYNVFCRHDHPLAGEALEPKDLLPGTWVLPPSQSTPRKLLEDIARQLGLPLPNVVVETISPTTMIACASRSDVMGWLPDPVFQSALIAGFLTKIEIPAFQLPRRIFLFKRAKGLLTPASKAFIEGLPLKKAPDAVRHSSHINIA